MSYICFSVQFQGNNFLIWKIILDGINYNDFLSMAKKLIHNAIILGSGTFASTISQTCAFLA